MKIITMEIRWKTLNELKLIRIKINLNISSSWNKNDYYTAHRLKYEITYEIQLTNDFDCVASSQECKALQTLLCQIYKFSLSDYKMK